MTSNPRLQNVQLPEFGLPGACPELGKEIYLARMDRLREGASEAGLDTIVVYGDR